MASRRAASSPLRLLRRSVPRPHEPNASRVLSQCRSQCNSSAKTSERQTHFGYETVTESEKTERVAGVFHSVAESYDRMNDLMSFGWHRVWK